MDYRRVLVSIVPYADGRPFLWSSELLFPISKTWAPKSVCSIVVSGALRFLPVLDVDNGIDEDSYACAR